MTPQAKSPALKLMTAEDRASLREAQKEWSSPTMLSLFEKWDLKEEVLRAYKRLRKCGQDPESALFFALDDCDLYLARALRQTHKADDPPNLTTTRRPKTQRPVDSS